MKKCKTIPIFVPHQGCPHTCVFCNQSKISGTADAQSLEEIDQQIKSALATIEQGVHTEIAFFGGSFTAIALERQEALLKLAARYIETGQVHSIRISTRPDAIDAERLALLKSHHVEMIELGVQSMDDAILSRAHRGHDALSVVSAAKKIREFGFGLGLQMMIGLPGDTPERTLDTVDRLIRLEPDCVRIYPVLVIEDTELAQQFRRGEYIPWELQEAAEVAAEALARFQDREITVIRLGLQASEQIRLGGDVLAGPFHPAFGEIVQSLLWRRRIMDALESHPRIAQEAKESGVLEIHAPRRLTSQLLGLSKNNQQFFQEHYGFEMHLISADTRESKSGLAVIGKSVSLYQGENRS